MPTPRTVIETLTKLTLLGKLNINKTPKHFYSITETRNIDVGLQ